MTYSTYPIGILEKVSESRIEEIYVIILENLRNQEKLQDLFKSPQLFY